MYAIRSYYDKAAVHAERVLAIAPHCQVRLETGGILPDNVAELTRTGRGDSSTRHRAIASAMGDRQMLPLQTKQMWIGRSMS